jgi:hypothetical protein
MQISLHFKAQEFVPRHLYEKYGENSTWWIDPIAVKIAEFYKSFWGTYYKKKYPGKVKDVFIVINNWHIGGDRQWSGVRTPEFTDGGKLSQHRYKSAFDCEIKILFIDGTKQEADYHEVHKVIQDNEREFLANGVTCVEDVRDATGWLHTDWRWIIDQTKILIVRA